MLHVLCLFTILITGFIQEATGSDFGQFIAGSVSFSVHKNDSTGTFFTRFHLDAELASAMFQKFLDKRREAAVYIADLEVITGWVLGKGPCGVNCSKSDIGMVTNDRRLMMTNMLGDPLYFGNWTKKSYFNHMTMTSDLNAIIQYNMNEKVIGMNTKAGWEQELMKVSIELEPGNTKKEIIYFEGDTWHPLTMQPQYLSWHIQAKIDKRIRNDTGLPNKSPIALFKPFYRIKLNKVSTIHIAATDPDGDLIKCWISEWSEGGNLAKHRLPGITVTEDCAVIIDASTANQYSDDSWAAFALTLNDYNRENIQLGEYYFQPFIFHLSGTAVQFLVQILEQLNAPVFVKPTAAGNHHFILYTGAVWRQRIYAKSNENTTIKEFTVTGRQEEFLQVSAIMDGNESHVRYIDIKWVSQDKDIGSHIICITATDDTGVDSDDDKCFIIEVRLEKFNHSSVPDSNRPYFIDIPAFEQVVECKTNVTCVLPLYVMSKIEIKTVKYTSTFLGVTEFGPITNISHSGHQVHETDLSFLDSTDGLKKICMTAIDIQGAESSETCIQSKLWPPDPCVSNPCKNSGKCVRSQIDGSAYACICISDRITGKNCEHVADICSPSPCVHGQCYRIPPANFFCSCLGTGFTGATCSFRENDKCAGEPCNGQGVCDDGMCTCFERYTGTHCENDACPMAPAGTLNCGKCYKGDNNCHREAFCYAEYHKTHCICPIGLTGKLCREYSSDNVSTSAFTDTAVPVKVTCVINRLCTIPLGVSTDVNSATSSGLEFGYVSPYIRKEGIATEPTLNAETVRATITITPLKTGNTTVCVQTRVKSSNEDELCISVCVTDDVSSIYGFQDKPSFIAPSLPTDTEVRCRADEPCHALYHVTTGKGHERECTSIVFTKAPFVLSHAFSTCSNCLDGYGFNNCSIDVTVEAPKTDIGKTQKVCVAVELKTTHLKGEERCFTVKVQSKADFLEKRGCQLKKCGNGGFCDSHVIPTVCFCPYGFSGRECNSKMPGTYNATSLSFISSFAVPTHSSCSVNKTCRINFHITGPHNPTPSLSLGYVDHKFDAVRKPILHSIQTGFTGSVNLTPTRTGEGTLCVQTNRNGTVDDELCIAINVDGGPSPVIDRTFPYFIDPPTPGAGSTLLCKAGGTCYIELWLPNGGRFASTSDCPNVKDTSPNVIEGHLHIFDPKLEGRLCRSTVAYITASISIGITSKLCFQVVLPGKQGEERCFNVTTTNNVETTVISPCRGKTCPHNSHCIGNFSSTPKAVCTCKNGFEGPNCSTTSTTITSAIQVGCDSAGWKIDVDIPQLLQLYPSTTSSAIYLGENSCSGIQHNSKLSFRQGLRECLTSEVIRNGSKVYNNELVYATRDPVYPFIIKNYHWTVPVECDLDRNASSHGEIHHIGHSVTASPPIVGHSHYSVNMSFFSDPNFMNEINGNPLQVHLGSLVYVKVFSTTADWTLKMRVHTCYTKPSADSPDHLRYYIIKNGCEADSNTHFISQFTHETRFVFQDFEYAANHETVSLKCDARFCDTHDSSNACSQTCHPVVKRNTTAVGPDI